MQSASLSRVLVIGLLAGAIVRGLLLASPGTPDVTIWKLWSSVAATDPFGLYGVGGSPPESRLLRWGRVEGQTDYPPLALFELAAVGRAYVALQPDFRDGAVLTVLVKAPGLLAECVLVCLLLTAGPRVLGRVSAHRMALWFWLNPAVVLNGAALGYLDAQMAVPAVGALLAVMSGRPGLAGGLFAVAVLTKPQALFAGPALVLALARQNRVDVRRAIVRFVVAGVVALGAIVSPIVVTGAWANMTQAVSRVGFHDMLSAFATNAWWILTWLTASLDGAPLVGWTEAIRAPVEIVSITHFVQAGYPNPRLIGPLTVVALVAWGCWRYRRATDPATWAYVGGWTVFTYFLWNVQVHENHLYLAVPMLALAAALDGRYRVGFGLVSAIAVFNMFVFYGSGDGWPILIRRHWTGIDASVLAAFGACAVWLWLTIKPPVPPG